MPERKADLDRKQTTAFLGDLLESTRLNAFGIHWAKEVSIDPFTKDRARRVDYMSFQPAGACYLSDIEKGIFTCYEIKSCREDVYSGSGLGFIGEKNYLVTTMQCYKDILPDIRETNKLQEHLDLVSPDSTKLYNVGIMVAVPVGRSAEDEFEFPTQINGTGEWKFSIVIPCREAGRRKSTTELLFCMLRSGRE